MCVLWGGLRHRGLGLAAFTGLMIGAALSSAAAQIQTAQPSTIAVLPLENNSGDAKQDFFAGGMTDEVAAAFGRMKLSATKIFSACGEAGAASR